MIVYVGVQKLPCMHVQNPYVHACVSPCRYGYIHSYNTLWFNSLYNQLWDSPCGLTRNKHEPQSTVTTVAVLTTPPWWKKRKSSEWIDCHRYLPSPWQQTWWKRRQGCHPAGDAASLWSVHTWSIPGPGEMWESTPLCNSSHQCESAVAATLDIPLLKH